MLFAVWTTAPAVVVCWCAHAAHEWFQMREALPRMLTTRAQIIGRNTAAALTFSDAKDAAATLETLRVDPLLLAAHVLSTDGTEFATYHVSALDHSHSLEPPPLGAHRFTGNFLCVHEPIFLDGERIGSIILQYSLQEFYTEFWQNAGMFATVAVLALAFALLLARTFRRSLADPVLHLAAMAAHVAEEKDYAVRAVVYADDELGALTRTFNGMLEGIQRRDADLRASNDSLELRVVERTSALAASEEQIQALVRDVNGIVWEADAKTWEFTFVSQRAKAILGYPLERWLGDPGFWVSILHPDDREWGAALCREASDAGEDHEFEYRAIAADGRVVWLRDLVRPVYGESGVEKLRGLMVDITDHKRNEAFQLEYSRVLEVLASDRALPEVLASVVGFVEAFAPGVFCSILMLDDEHRLTTAAAPSLPEDYNRAIDGLAIGPAVGSCGTAAYLGRRVIVEDVATDPLWENFRELALRHGLRACWSEPIRSGAGVVLGTLAMYYAQPRRPDANEVRLIETAAQLAKLALERARGEAERRRLSLAVEATADAVVVTDATGLIQYVNPAFCRITGYQFDELKGKKNNILDSKEHGPELWNRMWETIRSGGTWSGRVSNRRKDGSVYPAALTVSPVSDGQDHVVGFVGVQRDVTLDTAREQALADARDQAEVASRTKSEFLANMSHEIRTPMNGIMGMTELALGTELSQVQREYLDTVRSCADSLLVLLNDILDLSKIEAGKLELEITDFDLREAIEGVLDVVSHRASCTGVELIASIPSAIPRFWRGDPLRLRQVLLNLAGNAMKFTESGEVVVGVEFEPVGGEEGSLRFSVSDTGIGIPADRVDHIFETFTQADGATTRKYGGTGLGLAISRQIVSLMGGTIEVQSEVGVGSVFSFRVTMPLGKDQDTASARRGKPQPSLAALTNKRVLVVDDNATNRRVLKDVLLSWSCVPMMASDGSSALELLRHEGAAGTPIDIVLLDWQMPVISGHETARHIAADPSCGNPMVVLLSSMGGEHGTSVPDAETIHACIAKPIKQAHLAAVLTSLVQGESWSSTALDAIDASPKPPTKQTSMSGTPRVLLVEDNPVNRRVASGMLSKLGCTICEAENGQLAIELLERETFDLVFMDIQMPVLDGLETTARIRRDGRWQDLPIIAMTAHAMRGDRERCIEVGMNDYVSKPIMLDAVRAALLRWAGSPATSPPADAPSAASSTVAVGSATPPMDVEEALSQLGDDRELLGEVLDIFVQQIPQLTLECRDAYGDADMPRLQFAAHSIKGMTGNIRADAAFEVAAELERAAAAGEVESAEALLEPLEQHLERVRKFAASFSPQEGKM